MKKKVRKVLKRYDDILKGKALAKFQILKKKGLFQRKVKKAYEILESCHLCERLCHVNRIKGEEGFCGATNKIEISSAFSHYGEESFLVPSYTIFFAGCSFRCQFCQNYALSQREVKSPCYSVQDLEEIISEGSESCKNINFVGGECTPYLPYILDSLTKVKQNVPLVWNSNFYFSKSTCDVLRDTIDIYLSDFKYGPGDCAERLSNVPYQGTKPFEYWEVVKRNHDFAFSDGVLVIRHLIMPGHVECCSKKILDYIGGNYGSNCIVNLMEQYRPEYNVVRHGIKEINRRCTRDELKEVYDYAEKLGLCWIK